MPPPCCLCHHSAVCATTLLLLPERGDFPNQGAGTLGHLIPNVIFQRTYFSHHTLHSKSCGVPALLWARVCVISVSSKS